MRTENRILIYAKPSKLDRVDALERIRFWFPRLIILAPVVVAAILWAVAS